MMVVGERFYGIPTKDKEEEEIKMKEKKSGSETSSYIFIVLSMKKSRLFQKSIFDTGRLNNEISR